MTPKVRELYENAIGDEEFKKSMKGADDDNIRSSRDELKRHLIASMYYGWLVGVKGVDWNVGLAIN